MSSTRCSASAAYVWRCAIPKSPRCRRARSSKARSKPAEDRKAGHRRDHGAGHLGQRRVRPGQADHRRDGGDGRQGDRGQGALHVGTMIELPRAALRGGRDRRDRRILLVRHERPDPDDARRIARRRRLVPGPLPGQGSCRSIRSCDRHVRRGRTDQDRGRTRQATRPDIKLGVCGEHGGDPAGSPSARRGLDYVSCSPFRIPIARLAAAQAALGGGGSRTV